MSAGDRIDFGGAPWKALPRETLRDKRLTPKAKGGLVTLLSHEEGWVRSCIGTLKRENECGRDAAKAIMKELVAKGYATLTTAQDEKGRIRSTYTVHAIARSADSPSTGAPSPEIPQPETPATVVEPHDVDPQEVEPRETPSPGFDDLWATWPIKQAKQPARKAYEEALTKAKPEVILEAAQCYAEQARDWDMSKRQHLHNWLAAERWTDDYDDPVTGSEPPNLAVVE